MATPLPAQHFAAALLPNLSLALCLVAVALAAGYVVGLIGTSAGSVVLVGARPEGMEVASC